MKNRFLHTAILAMLIFPMIMHAQGEIPNIENHSDDFIQASLLIGSPSEGVFSTMGRTSIRLRCEEYGMDNVYSYLMVVDDNESEKAAFAKAKVRVGLLVMPYAYFIEDIESQGITTTEYGMNLPNASKKQLWKILDEEEGKGLYMGYGFFHQGCALRMMHLVEKALYPQAIVYAPWPSLYEKTYREIIYDYIEGREWLKFVLMTIYGAEADMQKTPHEKVIMPSHLAEVLQTATIDEIPVLTEGQIITKEGSSQRTTCVCTPLLLAVLLLLLTIVGSIVSWKWVDWVVLSIQALIGCVVIIFVYVIDETTIPWNWLLIAYNPLPLLLWHWRKYWALPYAVIVAIWLTAMAVWPHMLIDWAYYPLTFAVIIVLMAQTPLCEKILNKSNKTKRS